MADRKPDGQSSETSDERYDFGRPEQRGFWQGIEGLLKNLPLGDMSDVVARSSRIGRARLDTFLLRREREQLLRELGRIVADEARTGKLSLPLSALDTWERLLGVEARLAEELRDVANSPASNGFPERSYGVPETAAPTSEATQAPVTAAPETATASTAKRTAKSNGGKTIGRSKPRSTAAKSSAASTGEKKNTTGRKTKTSAANGGKEAKKTVGRRAPRKKGTPGGSDGSSQ